MNPRALLAICALAAVLQFCQAQGDGHLDCCPAGRLQPFPRRMLLRVKSFRVMLATDPRCSKAIVVTVRSGKEICFSFEEKLIPMLNSRKPRKEQQPQGA